MALHSGRPEPKMKDVYALNIQWDFIVGDYEFPMIIEPMISTSRINRRYDHMGAAVYEPLR